jgi:hypothetical protein
VAKVVLASVVGLLFVGLMLLLGAVVTRRRDGRLSSATAESRADTKVRGGGR